MKIKQIYSGHAHSLVLTGNFFWIKWLFLENHEIYAFGYNGHGQLGIGNEKHQYTTQLISFFKNMKINFISCGYAHSFVSTGKNNQKLNF